MGIKGLLGALRGHEERVHIRQYKGMVAAVDAMVWCAL